VQIHSVGVGHVTIFRLNASFSGSGDAHGVADSTLAFGFLRISITALLGDILRGCLLDGLSEAETDVLVGLPSCDHRVEIVSYSALDWHLMNTGSDA